MALLQRVNRPVFRRFSHRRKRNDTRLVGLTDIGQRGNTLAYLIDRDIADLGRVVASEFGFDRLAALVDIDIGIDHVGLVKRVRIRRCVDLDRGVCGGTLNAVNFTAVAVLTRGHAGAGPVRRAQAIAGHPDRLRRR